ncbi:MAG: HlyC/CorC family transporter [Actinomycetales bacterium]|nr:HlyC/CorC family transporter [Actinomycetales bacterium]
MSAALVVAVTASLIVLSAFFVAVEFSLMAVRRHRLEQAAAGSRAARSALRSGSELTIVLAGAQLGITVCTLGLGAITKPAVHHALTPVMQRTGLPESTSNVVAFILALFVVTFLHLVIGEMAPKSWAIAHPELVATVFAIPMRAYLYVTRPMLTALNSSANRIVRALGVEPVNELSTTRDPAALAALVEHSARAGALEGPYAASLSHALMLRETTLGDLPSLDAPITSVPLGSSVADVQAATMRSGHLRVLVLDGDRVSGVVHVRDTLALTDIAEVPATAVVRPALELDVATPLPNAITAMRESGAQIVVVRRGYHLAGVVTIDDILPQLLPAP